MVNMQEALSAGPSTPSPQRKKVTAPFNFLEAFPLTLLLKEIAAAVISSVNTWKEGGEGGKEEREDGKERKRRKEKRKIVDFLRIF